MDKKSFIYIDSISLTIEEANTIRDLIFNDTYSRALYTTVTHYAYLDRLL